jgi:hypothetical protein
MKSLFLVSTVLGLTLALTAVHDAHAESWLDEHEHILCATVSKRAAEIERNRSLYAQEQIKWQKRHLEICADIKPGMSRKEKEEVINLIYNQHAQLNYQQDQELKEEYKALLRTPTNLCITPKAEVNRRVAEFLDIHPDFPPRDIERMKRHLEICTDITPNMSEQEKYNEAKLSMARHAALYEKAKREDLAEVARSTVQKIKEYDERNLEQKRFEAEEQHRQWQRNRATELDLQRLQDKIDQQGQEAMSRAQQRSPWLDEALRPKPYVSPSYPTQNAPDPLFNPMNPISPNSPFNSMNPNSPFNPLNPMSPFSPLNPQRPR